MAGKTRSSRICAAVAVVAALPAALAADNLIRTGTFEHDTAEVMKEARHGEHSSEYGGSFDVFTEDLTWNKCGRLTAGPAMRHKTSGNKMSCADVVFAGADGKGIPVVPDQFYEYSFEVRSDAIPYVALNIVEHGTVKGKEVARHLQDRSKYPVQSEWKRFSGRFRTGKNAERVELQFVIWTYVDKPGSFGNDNFKPGDSLLIDNLSLVPDENFPKVKALLKKPSEPFIVAPYAVVADASCPFLPVELVNPPAKIAFRAAVNEKKPLPIAVANLTAAFAQYRVVLEANPADIDPKKPIVDTGVPGLDGFPNEKITAREALRFRDTESTPVDLRLDPLVDVNGASVISVPPKEAGAVWFDFDTYDVKPGVYRGRLHVIPFAEGVSYKNHGGAYTNMKPTEKVIPVEFTVDPIVLPRESVRPAHWCSPCTNEEDFRLESDVGARLFNVRTKYFTPEAVGNPQSDARKTIANYQEWARRRGSHIKFFVKYDALKVSQRIFNPKNDPNLKWEAWERYVHTVAKVMEEAGVPFEDYYVLLADEVANCLLPDIREGQKRLKRLYPRMQTYLSVVQRTEGKIDYIDYLADTMDFWTTAHARYMRPGVMERFNAVKAKYGSKLMHYSCQTSVRMQLSSYYRRHCWFGEYLQLDADMMFRFVRGPSPIYGVVDYKVIPWGNVSYSAYGRVMPSVRYMAYREGVTDIKYLQVLREKRGDEPEVAAFLKKAAERVVLAKSYSDDLPEIVREEARQLLLASPRK